MHVLTEPRVTVIGVPSFVDHPDYQLPEDGLPAERVAAFAAKGCYDSFGAGPDSRSVLDNQRAVIAAHHGSVAEHAQFTLFVEGISRGCSLELNRHRHLAISQRSTRYVAEEDAAIVLEPYYAELYRRTTTGPELDLNEQLLLETHLKSAMQAVLQYRMEVELLMALNPLGKTGFDLRKWARGKARNILPHALETRATYSANLRAWRHIITLRSERHAEPEIRRLMHHVFEALAPLAPVYFEDFTSTLVEGWPEYVPAHGRI